MILTNNSFSKWKRTQVEGSATTINKVVDFVSLSVYVNPNIEEDKLVHQHKDSDLWLKYLQVGLQTFAIKEEPFEFCE